jgi:Cys-tRNA(Pro)/Cys-tRNA(Cys) deacylase
VSNGTPALVHLARAGIPHQVHRYEIPEADGPALARGERLHYGTAAAAALGIPPAQMLKTLVVSLEHATDAHGAPGAPGARPAETVMALLTVDHDVSLKLVARAFGARRAALLDAAEVSKVTGYVIGGVSPFGTKRLLPVVIDETALSQPRIYLSAGQRGVAVEISSADLRLGLDARVAPISGAE